MFRLYDRCLRILALSLALVCMSGNGASAGEKTQKPLVVNGYAIDVTGTEPALPEILEPRKEKEGRIWIVQFDGPVQAADRERVSGAGCRLLDYLPDFAFLAAMDGETKKEVEKLPFINGVVRFKPAYKLQAKMRELAVAAGGAEQVRLHLKLDDASHAGSVLSRIQQMNGTILGVGHDTVRAAVDTRLIADLAALEEVTWINEFLDMQLFNDTSRWVIQTNRPDDLKLWENGLHGEGEIIGVGDTGLDRDMPWFRDPAGVPIGPGHRKIAGYDTTYGDDTDADYPGHGTHVSGTVSGNRTPVDGLTGGNGMAPAARIFVQDLSPGSTSYIYVPSDLAQLFIIPYAAGARLHTNSWGNLDNGYGPDAASTDRFAWEHRDFLPLFANGNSGPGSYTAGNPATAKNVISVGASYNGASAENMASFSSNGPSADGRIKPTVTAPGYDIVSADSDGIRQSFNNGLTQMSGTSMATPAVAGAAAMVRQYFAQGYYPLGSPSPGNAFPPSAALVKAVIINSAQEMTGSGTGGPIPSNGQGWGRINLAGSLPFAGVSGALSVADEGDPLETGDSWTRQFTVKGGDPLKVTMVWTDYPGATGAARVLVNDLDLMVSAPDGTVFLGNVFVNGESFAGGTPDRLNVEEQVLLKAPLPGVYTVSVSGHNVPLGPQPFALAISGAADVSPLGRVVLDRRKYNSGGTMLLKVFDSDLNVDPAGIEQIAIQVTSSAEPAGETVSLAETAADSAVFSGSIHLAANPAVAGDGLLQAANGDTITVVYQDSNDGSGRVATVTAVAIVDNVAPLMAGIGTASITQTGASVTWSTDEPADTELAYSDTLGVLATATDRRLMTQHTIDLAGLREGETYRFTAISTDEAGNTMRSSERSFTTVRLPPALSVASSEGNTTYQSTTVISGISTDPSGVSLVTVNGIPATYRSSDGFYTLAVSLQLGANTFTLRSLDLLGNEAVAGITVTRLQPSDLFMQSVEGPQTALQGGGITIADTVCNSGPGGAGGFSVGFYLSGDSTLSADDLFVGKRDVVFLAASSCSSGSSTYTLPAMAPGGSRYLIALADFTAALVETSRSNNSLAGNRVTLPEPQLATPSSITVPATDSSGIFQVLFGNSNVGGVTYILEMSANGGAYAAVYSGTNAWANMALTASGTFSFRVRVTRAGFIDSAFTAPASCLVTLACSVPASISVPATSSSGIFQVLFGKSNVGGVTYVLEMSKNGGGYVVVYSGVDDWANLSLSASGAYSFRVKVSRAGFTDSGFTAPASCVVSLACSVPASISVPATSSSGIFQVLFGKSNVGGVTYILEMSTNGGNYATVYSGVDDWANLSLSASGTYSFRVRVSRAGFADSAFTPPASCVVSLACSAPASISVPITSRNGVFQVLFGRSNVGGVTYVLEMSTNGGSYVVVYSGVDDWANMSLPVSGTYSFRVKAIRPGFADSCYTAPASSVVALGSGVLVRNVTRGSFHLSIDEAVATASTNDEIRVAETYSGSFLTSVGSAMLVTVSGGWDPSHQTQTGISSVGTVTIVGPGIIADRLVL